MAPTAIRPLTLLLFTSGWWCWCLVTARGLQQQPPNIVVLLADDLGWGDLGCFGNSSLRTPNIDRLALEGALLTHALAAASVCTPSRAALLTGRYPVRSGMTTSGLTRVIPFLAAPGGLPPQETTLAELVRQQGYRTAHIGKWHLGLHCGPGQDFCHHPLLNGYQQFYGLPWSNARDLGTAPGHVLSVDAAVPLLRPGLLATSAVVALNTVWWLSRSGRGGPARAAGLLLGAMGVLLPLTVWLVVSHLARLNGVLFRDLQVVEQPVRLEGIHLRFLREADAFLEAVSASGQPFLLTLAFTQAHTALEPTARFRGRSAHGLYGDIVEELDWAVGRVLRQLDRLGLTNNTFVFFTSDQGAHIEEVGADGRRHGGNNGPFRGGKGMASMEGGIRVPTLVRWPGHVPAGRRIHHPVSLMDLLPTVASLSGAPLPPGLDGHDMLNLLTGAPQPRERPRLMVHYCGTSVHAARWVQNDTNVWKVVMVTPHFLPNGTGCKFLCPCRGPGVVQHDPPLLYDVVEDPGESSPIPESDAIYREVVDKVLFELAAHEATLGPTSPPNQLEFPRNLWLPWLQPCCNFPRCECREED